MPRKIATLSKKLVLPVLAFFLLLSCSKDDDKAPEITPIPTVPSFLKVTIGGTVYNFNKFTVQETTVVEPDYTYVDMTVTATIVGDDTKEFTFSLEKNVPGPETIYYFYYYNGTEFDTDHDGEFNANVTVNAGNRIIGTFSGTLGNFDGGETIQLQNGSFDITY
ncbi:hypothetical protein [Flavobacterium sp.]|uniref:hypothetical protein n=1 Tax=Flavobacterium sp. TaxID=239 RepID=UPI0039E2F4D6